MTDDQLDVAIATFEDEEAAHQDTLRLWREAKAQLARAEKVIAAARPFAVINPHFREALAEYDRPAALPVTPEDGDV